MRVCKIEKCGKKHEARGYCKNHYKSLLKYGDPLQVEINRISNEQKMNDRVETKKRNYSTAGKCSVHGCKSPIKARKLCDMHYSRQSRLGSLERKTRSLKHKVDRCLVIDCEKEHYAMGYCSTHRTYELKNGTPYLPKIIKLCGVEGCIEAHWGKGLCKKHFNEWKKTLRLYGLY